MYTKEQASQLRQAFWTSLGQYMAPIPSSEGLRINWVNYKTGLKQVYFRMHADNKQASIGIEISHSDEGLRELFFEQFLEFKTLFHQILGEEWTWNPQDTDELGRGMARIYIDLKPANIFNQDDWPLLISFFKPRLVALDEFWCDAKYSFDALK